MRTRGVSRAEDLAAHLEVSVRTIYRDMAHLQASGLPIEGEAGVGYMLRPGFDLPIVGFTHEQIAALAIGLSFVESVGDTHLAAAAQEVRAKLQAVMPQPEKRILADAPFFTMRTSQNSSQNVRSLRKAIRHKHVVQFNYKNAAARITRRRVRPLALWNLSDGWMFSAWCELKRDFRTFRCDRMADFQITADKFKDDDVTGLSAFLAKENCETAHKQ